MNTLFMILFIALCIGSASAFIYLRVNHVGLHGFWGKLVASILFVIGGLVALMFKKTPSTFMYFIVFGLFLGMIGDILLELKVIYRPHEYQYTNGGICAFAISHVAYIVGLTLFATATKDILVPVFVSLAIGAVLATLVIVNSKTMGIDFNEHKGPVIGYSFILCIVFVYAVALAFLIPTLWIVAVGLLFFLASDLILSFIYWGNKNNKVMNILNLTFYYLAQIMMMSFLFVV